MLIILQGSQQFCILLFPLVLPEFLLFSSTFSLQMKKLYIFPQLVEE